MKRELIVLQLRLNYFRGFVTVKTAMACLQRVRLGFSMEEDL